jgi:hypothetical protein
MVVALQVNGATLAQQCYRVFGPRECTRREATIYRKAKGEPLKNPIRHVCSVWLYSSQGYWHTVHVCRRCGHREAVVDA